MEHFIDAFLEFLFGLIKIKPDKKPKIQYKDSFVVKHNTKKIIIRIVASIIFIVVFALLTIIVDNDTQILYAIFIILGLLLFLLNLINLSYKCKVNTDVLSQKFFFLFSKEVNWSDIICVCKRKTTDDSDVIIALYNTEGKCVLNIPTEMENACYIIKMAEHKNIKILEEKDLSTKKTRKK